MFTFRLQRLLELREKAEQAKAVALASAQQHATLVREERDVLSGVQTASRAEVAAAQHSEPRVGHLQQLGAVLQSLDQRLEAATDTVRAADEIVGGAQQLLDDAARDRRVLDRLKARHSEQWRNAEANKDRLGMDEIALSRFSRDADARTTDENATRTRAPENRPNSSGHNGSST